MQNYIRLIFFHDLSIIIMKVLFLMHECKDISMKIISHMDISISMKSKTSL